MNSYIQFLTDRKTGISIPALVFTLLFLLGGNSAKTFAQVDTQPEILCVNPQPSGSAIDITFNAPHTCGTAFVSYDLYYSNSPSGPFTVIAITDINAETYTHAISTASPVYYYMQVNCGPLSPSSEIVSSLPPEAPELVRVNVSTDNTFVRVEWIPNLATNAYAYIIYRDDENGNAVPIDTIYNNELDFYLDNGALPEEGPQAYRIATMDSCTLAPGPVNALEHATVHLTVNVDDCEDGAVLEWTDYQGWSDGVEEYVVMSEDGTGGTAPLDTVTVGVNTYLVTPDLLEAGQCYRILAIRSGGSPFASSNRICITDIPAGGPEYIFLKTLTIENGEVVAEWEIDDTQEITFLEIKRGGNIGDLARLSELNDVTITPMMEYRDNTAAVNNSSYYYQITHTDGCIRERNSQIGRTIYLRGRDELNGVDGLEWNAFELGDAVISGYTVYRQEPDSSLTAIGFTTPDELTFQASVDPAQADVQAFCYMVEAAYTIDCPDGSTANLTSQSNVFCVPRTPRIFVPTAFKPTGVNNIFKPVLRYPTDNYSIKVMNRWGEVVYSGSDPDSGWDGRHRGEIAPQGVYVYVIQMTASNGRQIERKGSVMLLR